MLQFRDYLTELFIDIPMEIDTMGIPRSEMPQIKSKHHKKFMKYLKKNGVETREETTPATSLKPIQKEFIVGKIEKNLNKSNDKPIMVSKDDYIIDGHHRWLAAKNINAGIPIIRANMNARELLRIIHKFPKVKYEK